MVAVKLNPLTAEVDTHLPAVAESVRSTATEDYLPGAVGGQACGCGLVLGAFRD
jgi:hypothetical protein